MKHPHHATCAALALLALGCGNNLDAKSNQPDGPDAGGASHGDSSGSDAGAEGGMAEPLIANADAFAPDLFFADLACSTFADATAPLEGEEGQWAAARLTHEGGAFTVTGLQYLLAGEPLGVECNNGLAHRVRVFKSKDVTPPTDPPVLAEVMVPASARTTDLRVVEVTLAKPLLLEKSESLFVAISMEGKFPDVMCLNMCRATTHPDRNYWSYSVEAPHPWKAMADLGINSDFVVGALGVAGPEGESAREP